MEKVIDEEGRMQKEMINEEWIEAEIVKKYRMEKERVRVI